MLNMTTNSTVANPYSEILGATRSATTQTSSEALQDRFLNLLTTQMKNQDPLNPLDNTELTSQLAQINTVTGLNQVNSTIEALSNSFNAFQTVQSALLVGKGVLVPGNQVALENAKAAIGYELTQPVDNLSLTIKDTRGNVVFEQALGPQPAGVNSFTWNGLGQNGQSLTDGTYSASWSATQGGKAVAVTGLTYGQVMGVDQSGSTTTLTISGQQTGLTLSQIRRIL